MCKQNAFVGLDPPSTVESKLLTAERNLKQDSGITMDHSAKFACKNCGDTFRWEKELSKHRRLDCKKKPYGCPECGQLLSRRDSLRQHLQRHGGGRKYPCKFCDKTFDQQQNLKVHLRIHSGERPYKCPECGRQFNQSQNLTTHLRVHSGVKPYVCNICGATFRFCSGYRSHMSRSHDPSKPARKRGRSKAIASQKQELPEAKVNRVHRVSVIARVSTSSSMDGFSSIQSVPSKNTCTEAEPLEDNIEIPSPFNAGLLIHSAKPVVSPPVPTVPDLQFTCQLCNLVTFNEVDIIQHMIVVHGLPLNDIAT